VHFGQVVAVPPNREIERTGMVALRVFLALGGSFLYLSVQPAELLTSVERIDGGRILSCDFELVSGIYQFTCDDKYAEFSLQCFVDVEWGSFPSPLHVERFAVICPVSSERSIRGNALRLACIKYDSKDIAWQREVARKHPEQGASRRIRMGHCASEKVDIDAARFTQQRGAAELPR
jgi:hypothetical protein